MEDILVIQFLVYWLGHNGASCCVSYVCVLKHPLLLYMQTRTHVHPRTHTQYTSWASSLYNHDPYSRWCEGHNCLGWNLFSASCGDAGQRQRLPEEFNCKVLHSHGKGAKKYRQRNMRKTDSRSQKWIIEAGKHRVRLQENPASEWNFTRLKEMVAMWIMSGVQTWSWTNDKCIITLKLNGGLKLIAAQSFVLSWLFTYI